MQSKLTKYFFPGHASPHISDLSLPEIPKFARLSNGLTRIASPAGVTYLKAGSIKSGVYLGSKYHAVDIEGVPWEKKTALKEITAGEKRPKKKLAPVETGAAQSVIHILMEQNSGNLSTLPTDIPTVLPELSPKPARMYKIKKSIVRNRLLAYTNTKKGSKCLYFFTVTFPAGMPESMGYRALNTWFTALRKQNLLHEYLWIAERQPQTGTIHFHIAVPHFMRVWHVNGIMRTVLRNYAKAKEIPFPPSKFDKYNGVDIAGTRNLPGQKGPKIPTNFAHKKKSASLANYLTKYITKNNETFAHLAWHNSRGFSALFYSVALSKESFEMTKLHYNLNWDKAFHATGKDGTPDTGLFVFVPWRGNAPGIFWDALRPVNDFFQTGSFDGLPGVQVDSSNLYSHTLKKYGMSETRKSYVVGSNRVVFEDAAAMVIENEKQQALAFIRFCGFTPVFCKEGYDEIRQLIIDRIAWLNMYAEFSSLRALLDKEHSETALFYTYQLYCYWAVDLLNQIPNN